MNRGKSSTARTRGLLVAAALTLHVAMLLPIALSTPREPPTPQQLEIFVVPLELDQVLVRRTAARRSQDPASGPRPPAPPRPRTPTSTQAPASVATLPSPPSPAAETADAAGQPVADPWRGRRPPSLPCPAPPGDRVGARLCLVGPTPAGDSETEAYADVGPPRRNSSEQAREDGFERQVRANEAWRNYTRGEGAYPGLRSLFRDR